MLWSTPTYRASCTRGASIEGGRIPWYMILGKLYWWKYGFNDLARCRRNPIDLVIQIVRHQMSWRGIRIITVVVVLVCAYEVESYTIIGACVENVPSCWLIWLHFEDSPKCWAAVDRNWGSGYGSPMGLEVFVPIFGKYLKAMPLVSIKSGWSLRNFAKEKYPSPFSGLNNPSNSSGMVLLVNSVKIPCRIP